MAIDNSNITPDACPTAQMSFSDAVRYLQTGFEEPVQRAIQTHVRYCNTCQDELAKVTSLLSAGSKRMMNQVLSRDLANDEDEMALHLVDGTLAAYVDGGLVDVERQRVTQHLSSCHDCYVRFSAVESELVSVGAQYATPLGVADALKVAPKPARSQSPSIVAALNGVIDRVAESVGHLLELKWPAPAMAFALGVLAMVIVYPSASTIVPLPGLAAFEEDGGRIHSGLGEAETAISAVVIPTQGRRYVTFSWTPPVGVDVIRYRVDIHTVDGKRISSWDHIGSEAWNLDVRTLEAGTDYLLTVSATTAQGGVAPVSSQAFRLELP